MIVRSERADGTPYWDVYGRRNGKKLYVGRYDSETAAKHADEDRRVTERKIKAGELPAEIDSRRTVKDAARDWLEYIEALPELARGSRSLKAYRHRLTKYIEPELGGVSLERLTADRVDAWLRGLSSLSAATQRAALQCLSSLLAWCADRRRGYVAKNVCEDVTAPKLGERKYVWLESQEECTRLIAACPPTIADIVTALLATGMRLDECLHLQVGDVLIERRLISVSRGRNQGVTKGGKGRPVPIFDAHLVFWRRLVLNRPADALVFPGRGGKPKSKPSVNRPFNAAARKAGIPPGFRVHDCRHSMAAMWMMSGGDVFRLSELLGHASIDTTLRFYKRFSPEAFAQDRHRIAFAIPADRPTLALVQ